MKKRRSPLLAFLICMLAVPTCAVLIGDLTLPEGAPSETLLPILRPWLMVGALLGATHLIVRPILRLLSAPLGCLTLGLIGFVIDVALIYACAWLVEGFVISSLLYAVLTALLINCISAVVVKK